SGGQGVIDLLVLRLRHLHRLTPTAEGPAGEPTTGHHDDEPASRPLIDDVARQRDIVSHTGPRIAAAGLTVASLLVVLLIVEPLAALIVAVAGGVFVLLGRPAS